METAKEKVIREAYKKYYDSGIDNDGWARFRPQYQKKENWYDAFPLDVKQEDGIFKYRPKSLQGIENNNGWIRIESEDDLPKEVNIYWTISELDNSPKISWFNKFFNEYEDSGKVTHYQPIIQPSPPIF